MATSGDDERLRRENLCKQLGLGNTLRAHEMVVAAARGPVENLTLKSLNAQMLGRLGYSERALRRLGYSDLKLQALGFEIDEDALPRHRTLNRPYGETHLRGVTAREVVADAETLRGLIASGARAEQLNSRGYNVVICKKAGLGASELYAIGFDLQQLRSVFQLPELRRAGFNVMDLKRFYNGGEFRQSGFSASEMRNAGFTARQLLSFGYPGNAVTTAGYSITELNDAGLSKRTIDRRGFQ